VVCAGGCAASDGWVQRTHWCGDLATCNVGQPEGLGRWSTRHRRWAGGSHPRWSSGWRKNPGAPIDAASCVKFARDPLTRPEPCWSSRYSHPLDTRQTTLERVRRHIIEGIPPWIGQETIAQQCHRKTRRTRETS